MTNRGIWVSPTRYVEFSETVHRKALLDEIASRKAAWDWSGLVGLLPDPDPVLRKLADGGSEVLEGLTGDGHVLSCIQQRKLGTLKKEFRWEPGTLRDEEEPSAEATTLRDQLVDDLERVDLYHLLSGILDAVYYGTTPIEIHWARGEGRLRLVDLQLKPARWFGYDDENRPKFVSQAAPWEGEALPFGKFVFARHFPTYDNPFGLRLLSRCFWPVAFKRGGVQFWVTCAEKFGTPFLLGKYRPGASAEEQQTMLARLTQMVQDAVAVIPDGGAVDVLQPFGSGTLGSIHKDLVAAMNAENSKVLVGQTLTAEVGDTGSYAASKTHENVLDDLRAGDQTLAKTVLEEIAWVYGQVNAPGVPSPELAWFEEEDPKKDHAERDKTLGETGVRFKKSYYVRQYGFKEDEFEVAKPRPDTPPTPGSEGPTPPPKPAPAEFTAGDTPGRPPADPAAVLAEKTLATLGDDPGIHAVYQLLQQAGSLEDARDRLVELSTSLDTAASAETIAQALVLAELAGRGSARREDGDA